MILCVSIAECSGAKIGTAAIFHHVSDVYRFHSGVVLDRSIILFDVLFVVKGWFAAEITVITVFKFFVNRER